MQAVTPFSSTPSTVIARTAWKDRHQQARIRASFPKPYHGPSGLFWSFLVGLTGIAMNEEELLPLLKQLAEGVLKQKQVIEDLRGRVARLEHVIEQMMPTVN